MMRSYISISAVLASLFSTSFATPQFFPEIVAQCHTRLIERPGQGNSTQTTTSTHFTPCYSVATQTVTTTLTPSAITATVTISDTSTATASTLYETDTSTTVTTTISDTTSVVVSLTTSSTVSVVTITNTIPAPDGFLPVQTTLPGSSYDGNAGADPIMKRQSKNMRRFFNPFLFPSGFSDIYEYLELVICHEFRPSPPPCLIFTSTTTSTVTVATPVASSTLTVTVGTTLVPSGTTFTTAVVTTTSVTVDLSSTASTTVSVSTSYTTTSVYAACATNNFASQYEGINIYQILATFQAGFDAQIVATAYDCCVAAMTNPDNVQAWGWIPPGACGMAVAGSTGTCNAQADAAYTAIVLSTGTTTWGNGPCGEINAAVF